MAILGPLVAILDFADSAVLQAVQCCRRCSVVGGERGPPGPLGWYFFQCLRCLLATTFLLFLLLASKLSELGQFLSLKVRQNPKLIKFWIPESLLNVISNHTYQQVLYSNKGKTWKKERTRGHCPWKFLWIVEISVLWKIDYSNFGIKLMNCENFFVAINYLAYL